MIPNSRPNSFLALVSPKVIVALFFLGYLALGLSVYKDYGLSWDELVNRRNGAVSAMYINAKLNHLFQSPEELSAKVQRIRSDEYLYARDPERGPTPRFDYTDSGLHTYLDRDYGVFFELPLIALEALLKLEDSRDVYLMRHLCTFLLFYTSVFFFYLLAKRRFESWILGLTASSLLILSPRIFADSFYNSKDVPFLSLFVISTYTLLKFLENPSILNAFFHALVSAALIDIRVSGVVMPAITVVFLALDGFKSLRTRTRVQHALTGLVAYVCLLPCLIILFWPYLWENPARNFLEAVAHMTRFRWDGDVLYLGSYHNSTSLPWHYVPVWIAVTTPPFYLFLFLLGVYYTCKTLKKNRLSLYGDNREREDLVHFSLFFLPIVLVVVLKSVLYDGWRHLFFIYPAFLSIALRGLVSFSGSLESLVRRPAYRLCRAAVFAMLVFSLSYTAYVMFRYHPHEQVYFNVFAGTDVRRNFQLDYWGVSYREGLEYVLRNDASPVVRVNVANFPGKLNARILESKERQRLQYVALEDATYFLADLRSDPWDYPFAQEQYSIEVGPAKILAVYKLR